MEMNERGDSSTAIVAIVVLVLISLFVFMFFFRGGGKSTASVPDKINIEVKPPGGGQ